MKLGAEGVTSQMRFDSHIERLLDATVLLVNLASPGDAHGTAYAPPVGEELVRGVADATSSPDRRSRPTAAEAVALLDVVPRARDVFEATDRGDLATAAGVVNDLLDVTAARPRLDPDDEGRYQLHFHGPDDGYVRGWQAGIASGLAVALGSDLGGRLGVCEAPACDRVHVDGSRNGTRRFCSPRCQSRVKAAAHRARTR